MLKMSFYNGSLDRKKAAEVVKGTDKKLMSRFGFAYRGAEKHEITKAKALEIIEDNSNMLDVDEYESEIVLNTYSEMDMW